MNRKEFLRNTALATIALNLSSVMGVFAQGDSINGLLSNAGLTAGDLEKLSPELNSKISDLWLWMKKNGWLAYARELVPEFPETPDLKKLIHEIDAKKLDALRQRPGFEDFGGHKFIEPGYPALSLLYHMFANPLVRPEGIPKEHYPELKHNDLLEDYIYGLKKWRDYKKSYHIKDDDELVLALFAYEYRTAHKTPHHCFADMVFSRTGIGRIGTNEPLYDKFNRCYTNNPSGNEDDRGIAVTPARYGLFIAKKSKINGAAHLINTMKMAKDKTQDVHYIRNENDYDYLIPVRKLFHDDLLTDKAKISFSESHKSIKIAEILQDKSYIKNSADLVKQESINSSVLVSSIAASLVNPVLENSGKKALVSYDAAFVNDNRYFTAYYNGNGLEVESIELYDSHKKTRVVNDYNNPRNLPMYLNLSHKIENGTIVPRNRKADDSFEKEIYSDIKIPLFEDNICDGYIAAKINIAPSNILANVAGKGILNAFSIITAPDFLPQVDDYDFQQFDVAPGGSDKSLFFEGGIASLANCSIPPNPVVYEGSGTELLSRNAPATYTTVISNFTDKKAIGKYADAETYKGYFFSSFLPDMCSSIFAPGWDITYCGTVTGLFLSTQGLGAPFVEDMKLCAAMNGMWPAASPDASRTYQGSPTTDEYKDPKKEWLRNPVSIPLMDIELGNNLNSSHCKEYGLQESFGWDGEQGPFLEFSEKKYHVNFTDLGRADYVENAMHNRFDMSKLRKLESSELNLRMHCLSNCTEQLGFHNYPNGYNDMWMVSAEKVRWDSDAKGYGLPKNLMKTGNNDWAAKPQKDINGDGYLYVFVTYTPDEDAAAKKWVADNVSGTDNVKRRRIACNEIIVCQACRNKVRYYKITNPDDAYDASKWI